LQSIKTTLSGNEYRLIRILRALGNNNRYIIFKNLEDGPRYAATLNEPLKISRPALGKHARRLIVEGLIEQKHVVEGGTAKTVYELTEFGKKIIEDVRNLTDDLGVVRARALREELMEVNAQINSMKTILNGLEMRVKNNEISSEDHSILKSDYDKKLDILKKRENEIRLRLENK
jgi:DNA-binding MarR family transcriptional regulator